MNTQHYLDKLGFDSLNELQEKTIAAADIHEDLLVLSPTGSGKTLAFLFPLIARLTKEKSTQAVIIVPSRELALQVESVFKSLQTGFNVLCCYGGHHVKTEENALSESPTVVIGTPGRLCHHLRKKNLFLQGITFLVLDEFDKSLEAGFHDEMSLLISNLPAIQQRILTSATRLETLPDFVGIEELHTLDFLKNEIHKPSIVTEYIRVEGDDKTDGLMDLLSEMRKETVLVFFNHRDAVERISDHLQEMKYEHAIYHGGLDQIERERALIKFRNGSSPILLATDLASRGLDITGLDAVIHYQLPATLEVCTHRNGRTGRMHASGRVVYILDQEGYLPKFLTDEPTLIKPSDDLMMQPSPLWVTFYIGSGKKEKINKMDLVGAFCQQGGLVKEEIGRIDVLDHCAFLAVQAKKAKKCFEDMRDVKIKGKKVILKLSR